MTDQNGLERTSATERLRALLTERGVECTANDGEYVKETCWTYMGELTAAFAEYYDGTTRFACDTWCFTPEQAVAATLGDSDATDERHSDAGTCRVEESWHGESEMVEYRCTACDEYMAVEVVKPDGAQPPNYCPNCGRRVDK